MCGGLILDLGMDRYFWTTCDAEEMRLAYWSVGGVVWGIDVITLRMLVSSAGIKVSKLCYKLIIGTYL